MIDWVDEKIKQFGQDTEDLPHCNIITSSTRQHKQLTHKHPSQMQQYYRAHTHAEREQTSRPMRSMTLYLCVVLCCVVPPASNNARCAVTSRCTHDNRHLLHAKDNAGNASA